MKQERHQKPQETDRASVTSAQTKNKQKDHKKKMDDENPKKIKKKNLIAKSNIHISKHWYNHDQ